MLKSLRAALVAGDDARALRLCRQLCGLDEIESHPSAAEEVSH